MTNPEAPGRRAPETPGTAPRIATPGRRRSLLLGAILLILLFAWFEHLALGRFVARDEGFYLFAARLVAEGQTPYLDFFHPQMPFFPYLYGLWGSAFGFTWTAARTLSALCAALTGWLVFLRVRHLEGPRIAFLSLLLFAGSSLSMGWLTIAKSYALSTLLLFAAYYLAVSSRDRKGAFLSAVSGGLAVATRLYLVVAALPIFLLRPRPEDPSRARAWRLAFLAGCALVALPVLILLAADPESFWFNNYHYHTLRAEPAQIADKTAKWRILAELFGLGGVPAFLGEQFALLLVPSLIHCSISALRRREVDLAAPITLIVGVALFLPTPSFVDYFVALVPFLVVLFCRLFGALLSLGGAAPIRYGARALAAALLAGYAIFGLLDYRGFLITGKDVYRDDPLGQARLDDVRRVSAAIDELTEPGAIVMSQWPGYLFETRAAPYPGMENHFWVRVATKLSSERRARFRIGSHQDIRAAVLAAEPDLIVIDRYLQELYVPQRLLAGSRYRLVRQVDGVILYGRSEEWESDPGSRAEPGRRDDGKRPPRRRRGGADPAAPRLGP